MREETDVDKGESYGLEQVDERNSRHEVNKEEELTNAR